MTAPRFAWIHLDGWSGRSRQRVEVVGETPTRVRIRAIERTRLAGPARYLEPGALALVPRRAVEFDPTNGR